MVKALKVTMIVYGVVGIVCGLAFFFAPEQLGSLFGFDIAGNEAGYLPYFLASLGVSMIAASVFIIAASRDPLRHIYWVKYAILLSLLGIVAGLYSVVRGYVDFNEAMGGLIIGAVFAIAFLIFYPYKPAQNGS